jgi:hypothetical protein
MVNAIPPFLERQSGAAIFLARISDFRKGYFPGLRFIFAGARPGEAAAPCFEFPGPCFAFFRLTLAKD